MNLDDLYKLAGIQTNETPAVEPTEVEQPVAEQPMDGRDNMKAMIALVTPEQLNQLVGDAPVAEEGFANSGDEYAGEPEEYKGTLGSPADLSLRRYLGANGVPVNVDETKVYEDHKVEDITEAWKQYKAEPVAEHHQKDAEGNTITHDESVQEAVVDEDDVEEDNAFNTAAANAKKAGKSHFTFNNKKYPVKIDDKTADALTDDIDRLRALAGTQQVEEAGPNYPGEYDYMDPKYMNLDGSSKVESSAIEEIMAKHPEEVAKMKQTGDLDSGSDLYMDLVDYYSDEMPYGTMKARDGDPVEYILDKLDDMGMLESKVAEEQQVDEAPFPGEYDYSDDKYDADGAVTGVNDRDVDLRFAKWSKDTPSELMMVIKKYNLDPMDAYQMATADVNADIDAIADLHDAYTDRMGIPAGPMDDDMSDLHDIDGGEKWLDSPEYDKVMTMVGDLCSAMGMEGAGREECGQALMKHVDENIPQESVNRLKKLAGI